MSNTENKIQLKLNEIEKFKRNTHTMLLEEYYQEGYSLYKELSELQNKYISEIKKRS